MKKISFIYILAMLISFIACSTDSGFDTVSNSKSSATNPKDTAKVDTTKWANCVKKYLTFDKDTVAHAVNYYHCTNGSQDSSFMEPWKLELETTDLVVYRNEYQPSVLSGITPDAERTTSEEYQDKYNNLVKDYSYTQRYKFNNFTHSISGAWRAGRIFYGNGKEESYLPEDGLYYHMTYEVGDTVHFVRNDTIYAKEPVYLEYDATLKETSESRTWRSWIKKATVTVISFIGLVEHEPEIPTAEFYVPNLKFHAASGNRFYKKISENTKSGDVGYWEDGFLMSSDTHYIMLIVHYTVDAKDGKSNERFDGKEIIFRAKSEMITPAAGREYNAVMYDSERKKYIPCCLSKDHNFSYGSQYADGSPVSYQPDTKGSVMDGVKNFAKDNDANPSPWLQTSCVETQYNGKNYYTIMMKSDVHNNVTTIADEALKK